MSAVNGDTWLTNVIKNDATLAAALGSRVFPDYAPKGTIYPLVLLNLVAGEAVTNANQDLIMDVETWRVKIYTDAPTFKNIGTLADRIRLLCHKASGTGVIGCVYSGSYRLSEIEDGITYRSIILEFDLFTQ